MSEIHEIETENGVFKWNTELKPRGSSGKVGEITINNQQTANEVAEIQRLQENKPELKARIETFLKNINNIQVTTDKENYERFVLSIFGIAREDIKADTTNDSNDIKAQIQKLYKNGLTTEQIITRMQNSALKNKVAEFFPAEKVKTKADLF